MSLTDLRPSARRRPVRPAPAGSRHEPPAVVVTGGPVPGAEQILTPGALQFLANLHRFAGRRDELLTARRERRRALTGGAPLDFLPATARIRADPSWQVPWPGPGLEDRRVEITSPATGLAALEALCSGANVWVADLEDTRSSHFALVVRGQVTLRDAVRRTIACADRAEAPRALRAGELPTIMVRPRSWHLDEEHLRIDGRAMVGALVDAGLYLFHNASALLAQGSGPYLSLPKLEGHLEARLWHDVLTFAEGALGLERGAIRATVPIQTVSAALEMEEILFELREHSAGLAAAPGDYLFSIIKHLGGRPGLDLPIGAGALEGSFARAYAELLVSTCHRRGAHAIGAMAAAIPGAHPGRDSAARAAVIRQKEREADAGFDGSRVPHPTLVAPGRAAFDGVLGFTDHQIRREQPEPTVGAADLLDVGAA